MVGESKSLYLYLMLCLWVCVSTHVNTEARDVHHLTPFMTFYLISVRQILNLAILLRLSAQ